MTRWTRKVRIVEVLATKAVPFIACAKCQREICCQMLQEFSLYLNKVVLSCTRALHAFYFNATARCGVWRMFMRVRVQKPCTQRQEQSLECRGGGFMGSQFCIFSEKASLLRRSRNGHQVWMIYSLLKLALFRVRWCSASWDEPSRNYESRVTEQEAVLKATAVRSPLRR